MAKLTMSFNEGRINSHHREVVFFMLSILLFPEMVLSSDCEGVPEKQGNFGFTTKKWDDIKKGKAYTSMAINCSTNNSNATLWLQNMHNTEWKTLVVSQGEFSVRQVGSMFVLPELAFDNSGQYRCLAKLINSNICLYKGLLVITDSNEKVLEIYPGKLVSITEGEELTFSCLSEGIGSKDDSLLTWYKKVGDQEIKLDASLITRQGEIKQGMGIDRDVVTIRKVTKKDAGIYICKKPTSGGGVSNKLEVKVTDPIAPVVTLEPDRRIVTVLNGDRWNLATNCTVTSGKPMPERVWRDPAGKELVKCDKTEPSCPLLLRGSVLEENHGNYTCIAKNSIGESSKAFSVNVQVGVVLEKPPSLLVAGTKNSVTLKCKVKKGNPLATIAWDFQVMQCPDCQPDTKQWTGVFDKISVTPKSSLKTDKSMLVVPPANFGAFYRCQASNSIGSDSYTISLHRLENPQKIFRLSSVDQTSNENETFHLNCSASTSLYLEINWMKDGQPLKEKAPRIKITSQNDFLLRVKIIKVQRLELNDNGVYSCVAKMENGTLRTLYHRLVVKALKPPFIDGFVDQTLNETLRDAILFCNATGNPIPDITWKFPNDLFAHLGYLKDTKECETRKQGLFFLEQKSRTKLVICDMNYKLHEGAYECVAQNKVGKASATIQVKIHAKPSIVNWNENVVVEPEGIVRLFCEASGNPAPNVTISAFAEKIVPIQGLQRYGNGSAYVSFKLNDDIRKENYVCTATNAFGAISKYAKVTIAGRTSTVTKPVSSSIIASVVIACLVFLALVVCIAVLYKRKLDRKYAPYLKPNKYFQFDPDRSLFEQSGDLPYDPDWEFPRERLNFLKMVGSGAFGEVWLAEAQGILTLEPRDKTSIAAKRRSKIRRAQRYIHIQGKEKNKSAASESSSEKTLVAVKTLKGDASDNDYKDLASELKILIHIGENKQIVNLLGACTRGGKLCVLLEYCPNGSLLNFLRDRRDIFEPVWFKNEPDMARELTYIDLTMIAYQIAKGLDFLSSKKCVHRDVAARNVLVGVDYIIKIADFGLARDIYKDELYMKSTSGLLPVKWMAPESLFDKIYTSQSDVWSYGIVLWEIFTLGGSPYPGLPTEDLFGFLEQGRRMEQPELCPLEFYAIMNDCWERIPNHRPLFSQLVDRIGQIISNRSGRENPYLHFEQEDGPPIAAESDYLIPIVKGSSMSDEYISATPARDVNDTNGREDVPAYLNDDTIRMSLLEGYESRAPTVDISAPYLDSNEVAV